MDTTLKNEILKEKDTAPSMLTPAHKQWWCGPIEFIFYLFIAVILLEGFFRLAHIGQQEFLQPDLTYGCKHIPNKVVTWRLEGYSNDRINSKGLRDSEHTFTKPANTYRIALLGDSATESLQVDLPQTYGKVLQDLLNESNSSGKKIEVINFGCSSYSTGQELLQYQNEAQKYQPDAIVLLFNRGDASENSLNQSAKDLPEPRPYFYLDQKGELLTDNTVLQIDANKLRPNPFIDFLRAHSCIYGVITETNLSLSLTDSRYRKLRAAFEKVIASLQNKSITNSIQKINYPQQDDLKVTEAIIKNMAEEAAKRNQTFVLMTFPNPWHESGLAAQTEALRQLAVNEHFYCLDLTPAFLANGKPFDNFLQYHFSPAGHKLIGQQLCSLFRAINR